MPCVEKIYRLQAIFVDFMHSVCRSKAQVHEELQLLELTGFETLLSSF